MSYDKYYSPASPKIIYDFFEGVRPEYGRFRYVSRKYDAQWTPILSTVSNRVQASSARSTYAPRIAYRPTDTLRSFFRPAAARSYFLKRKQIRPPTPRPSPEWRRQFRARLRRSRRGRFMLPRFKKRRRKR